MWGKRLPYIVLISCLINFTTEIACIKAVAFLDEGSTPSGSTTTFAV